MEYLTINSFRYGLDKRRSEVVSQPGTLDVLENAHINAGGEIERRKAFVEYADVNILDDSGNQGTFGLEVTALGLVVFGSANPSTGVSPKLASAMPTGITYQQLKHPSVADALVTYNATYHRLTEVVHSANFSGKAFVIAKFSDGNKFLYYDGAYAPQSRIGRVLTGEETAAMQADIITAYGANVAGWVFANTFTNSVDIKSSLGSSFTMATETDDISASFVQSSIAGSYDGTVLSSARESFSIDVTNIGTDFTVLAPNSAGTEDAVTLCSAVPAEATAELTAKAIVAAINLGFFTHDYTAEQNANTVVVYAPQAWGDALNGKKLTLSWTVSTSGGASLDIAGAEYRAELSPPSLTKTVFATTLAKLVVSDPVTVSIYGSNAPFTCEWVNADGTKNKYAVTQAFVTSVGTFEATFRALVGRNETEIFDVRLKVTNSAGTPEVVYSPILNVALTFKYGTV